MPSIKQWQGSQEVATFFCQRLNLNLNQFNYWRRKLLSKVLSLATKFIKVEIESPQIIKFPLIIIELPSGIKISLPSNVDGNPLTRIFHLLGMVA